MILPEQLANIGSILKTHGINGEVSATMDADISPDNLRCIVLYMDGIPVPFFIEEWRGRGAEAVLLTIEGINSEAEARNITGKDIFAFVDDLPQDDNDGEGFYLSDFIGWTLMDGNIGIGTIEDFDDSTINLLLIVNRKDADKPLYIPFAEEFITGINPDRKVLEMNLPEGILDL